MSTEYTWKPKGMKRILNEKTKSAIIWFLNYFIFYYNFNLCSFQFLWYIFISLCFLLHAHSSFSFFKCMSFLEFSYFVCVICKHGGWRMYSLMPQGIGVEAKWMGNKPINERPESRKKIMLNEKLWRTQSSQRCMEEISL